MRRRAGHIVIASLSVLGGLAALILTHLYGELWGPGTLLAAVLLLNAAVRYRLWRG